ncbi:MULTISPECIES: hypothetical protein [Pseudomonas]|uniref:hypothetical protein n=1 Tax=Pseudomonas TaxID=286 RepID=UPI000F03AB93|nr:MULTISPECIES: hypothetical protein [Pseudomonas]MBD8681222.1 hypothetical protein [Pseudomonas sp. CFBP 13719]
MKDRIAKGELGLGFHGSSQKIMRFASNKVGQGSDSNSSLGLCLSQVPLNALDYALGSNEAGEGKHVLVYVVAFPSKGLCHQMTPDEFFGIGADGKKATHDHFSHLRAELIRNGYDRIDCETGEDAITVALVPDDCQIVASLDQDAIEKLESSGVDCFDALALFEAIKHYIPAPGRTRQPSGQNHEYS